VTDLTCPACRDDEFGMPCVVHQRAPSLGILESQTHPSKLRTRSIVLEIWPSITSAPEGARRMADVENVLAGRGTPTLSQVQRDAITEAAKRIPE